MNTHPREVLKRFFGYDAFRGLQEEIICDLIKGQDLLVLMPTGGGKSLCYQIPALIKQGITIVVSPLIALMEDQVANLKSLGIRAAYYNSSLSSSESKSVLSKLHAEELDLLYVAPERLLSQTFLDRLKDCSLAFFAIDEAHCISQWGHDFRPEYTELSKLKAFFPETPIIALTATADQQTRLDIVKQLNYQPKFYIDSFNRPNIHYTVLMKDNPLKQIQALLALHQNQAGIIYCGTRNAVDQLSLKLQEHGFKARGYHAGLSHEERKTVQDLFRFDSIDIVVATVAFGMGIDKPNVRFVLHYDLPKTIESYYQETGRAGRDGLAAKAVLLFDPKDSARLRSWVSAMEDNAQQRIENNKLNHMIAFAEASHCRRQILLQYFDEPHKAHCDYCDICDNPPQMEDTTEDAQKFLSCIFRLGQNYGMAHVIEVLRGSTAEKIRRFGHDQVSTYGIGKDKSSNYWKHLAWQLIYRNYCYQDILHFNVLRLRKDALALLKGQEKLMLSIPAFVRTKKEQKPARIVKEKGNNPYRNDPLFESLRLLRKALAEEEAKPPFVIFSDATLYDMVEKKPKTLAEMRHVSGVGEYKLKHYGEQFLALILEEGS